MTADETDEEDAVIIRDIKRKYAADPAHSRYLNQEAIPSVRRKIDDRVRRLFRLADYVFSGNKAGSRTYRKVIDNRWYITITGD